MKLELKHLDFANNAKVKLSRLPHWEFENVNLQDCELSFNGYSKEPYLRYKDVTFGMDQIIIYKRPLSQITKEIEHNGEKFVPMGRLSCLYEFEKRHDFYLSMYIDGCWIYSCNELPYDVIEKLLEWHFDIFGLIEKGLAEPIKN